PVAGRAQGMRRPVERPDALPHGAATFEERVGRNSQARWPRDGKRPSLAAPALSCGRGADYKKMQQDILVNWSPQETRVAITESGAVQELHVERTLERGLVGNIYLGKVARVLPGMQSAFIDMGQERAAFLHVADVWQRQPEGEAPPQARNAQAQVPIEKQVF